MRLNVPNSCQGGKYLKTAKYLVMHLALTRNSEHQAALTRLSSSTICQHQWGIFRLSTFWGNMNTILSIPVGDVTFEINAMDAEPIIRRTYR